MFRLNDNLVSNRFHYACIIFYTTQSHLLYGNPGANNPDASLLEQIWLRRYFFMIFCTINKEYKDLDPDGQFLQKILKCSPRSHFNNPYVYDIRTISLGTIINEVGSYILRSVSFKLNSCYIYLV